MKIASELLAKSRQKITVLQTEQEVESYFSQAQKNLARHVKLPGFRPGKAPAQMAEKQLKPEDVREEALRLAVSEAWREALKSVKTSPIEDPAVEVEKFDRLFEAKMIFQFDYRPEVKMGNWQAIKVLPVKTEPVSEKDVQAALDSFADGRAKRVAKEGSATKGDELEVKMSGFINNKPVQKLEANKLTIRLGKTGLIPGLAEKLIGIKRGEKREFSLHLPANHFEKDLAGQRVDFRIETLEVFSVLPADIDDKLAQEAGFKSLAEMKEKLRKHMLQEREARAKADQQTRWLTEFQKTIKTDLPESLLKKEVERLKERWQAFLTERNLSAKQWLEARQTTMEEMEKDWQKSAQSQLEIGLGMAEVAKAMNKELKNEADFRTLLEELSKTSTPVS